MDHRGSTASSSSGKGRGKRKLTKNEKAERNRVAQQAHQQRKKQRLQVLEDQVLYLQQLIRQRAPGPSTSTPVGLSAGLPPTSETQPPQKPANLMHLSHLVNSEEEEALPQSQLHQTQTQGGSSASSLPIIIENQRVQAVAAPADQTQTQSLLLVPAPPPSVSIKDDDDDDEQDEFDAASMQDLTPAARRKLQNRLAQRKCRENRNQRINQLEQTVADLVKQVQKFDPDFSELDLLGLLNHG
ncbi:hypothetical protein BDR26DRAFT_871617 [Obelidium mucronatum]|nr:hypothetical protein BDR26DRAFT_871617 [Obelidium mucronatum]